MHTEKHIKIKSFQQITNPNLNGCKCALDERHFIDYKEICYQHPTIRIIICKQCKGKENKYHNVPREYEGHIYHSTFESEYAKQLDLKIRTGLIKGWEKQVKIELNIKMVGDLPVLTDEKMEDLLRAGVKAYHITNYFMDFVVTNNDDSITLVETKGAETSLWKFKFKLTEIVKRNKVNLEVIKKQNYKPKKKEKK